VKTRNKNGQEKKCLLLSSNITLSVQDIIEKDKVSGGDKTLTIPSICIENIDFDESQGKC